MEMVLELSTWPEPAAWVLVAAACVWGGPRVTHGRPFINSTMNTRLPLWAGERRPSPAPPGYVRGVGGGGATLPPCLARVHTRARPHGTDSGRHPWAHHAADHLALRTSSTVFTPRTANRPSSFPGVSPARSGGRWLLFLQNSGHGVPCCSLEFHHRTKPRPPAHPRRTARAS